MRKVRESIVTAGISTYLADFLRELARAINSLADGWAPNKVSASSVPNGTVFVDSADGKLKFKDALGVVNNLY